MNETSKLQEASEASCAEAQANLSDFPEASECEIVDPNSTRSIYEEALAESLTSNRDVAKSVIAERIKEIQHLEMLLAKAKADLHKLLSKDVTEIAMTSDPRVRDYSKLLGGPVRKGISGVY